jgi:hypothetical protein
MADGNFDYYHSIIGKLNFLKKSMRPELAFMVHQCACFSSNPQISHAKAVRHIGKYLLQGTSDKGIILDPTEHSFRSTHISVAFGIQNWP